MHAITYILEDPNSKDYRYVMEICRKIFEKGGISDYEFHDYQTNPELRNICTLTHCDAVMVIDDLHIFIEMTSRAKSLQKTEKFAPTIAFFRQYHNITKMARVLHYTSADAGTARLIKSRKTYKDKIVPMSCKESLIPKLRSYRYSI